MDELVSTFLAVTGIEDESTAKQYLEITNNDLEYAVTLYMESNPPANASGQNASHGDDEELAQRLQQEAYGNEGSDVREADTNIHRHETLVDSFGGDLRHHLILADQEIYLARAGLVFSTKDMMVKEMSSILIGLKNYPTMMMMKKKMMMMK